MSSASIERADIAIVGGGASGLAAGAAMKRRGIEPVILERDDRIGGTWARRYEKLRLHTTRALSGLPFHPLPRGLPRYITKDDYSISRSLGGTPPAPGRARPVCRQNPASLRRTGLGRRDTEG